MIETSAVPALQLSGLVKRFDDKVAVADIDLVVPPTSFYGLVGPNGAGKTTTLSMATGLLRPDAGTAWVHGVDVWADPVAAKAMIGNLADGVRLFDRLTGEQLITYTAMMFSVPREQIAPRV
uniref:ATP-binding cassette domain-containing protein n=1 Tax=Microbacterium lacticum TaxID=33885 RepID=UPI001F574FF5